MKIADLYIRVSTDEQAEKGYSQRNQEEMLLKYCGIHNIQVRNLIFEDHSAKTFERPEWKKLLINLRTAKAKHSKANLILFTKWDRFSRNAGDAYQMIGVLRKLGVEPQAIEQPLDLAIPENKMMLAFYLAAPEVENDRRALNTYFGMRRARKEGRYMGVAPVGYKNTRDKVGNKIIAFDQPQASVLIWAFEELAKDRFAADEIRKMANQKGLRCSKSNFWTVIRNPVYCGKIKVEQYKDEEAHLVEGQHEALISEQLFYTVQQVLNDRKKKLRTGAKITSDEMLPLRGFLKCPKCDRMLTGSASRSRLKRYYYYYHCISSCGIRYKAPEANALFEKELGKFRLKDGMEEVYRKLVKEVYLDATSNHRESKKKAIGEIERLNQKLTKTRNLLIADVIDSDDFQAVKTDCQEKIRRLEATVIASNEQRPNINATLDKALSSLSNLDMLYTNAPVKEKRIIIGSIWPENLTYDGKCYRTHRVNTVASYIYTVNQEVIKKKSRAKSSFARQFGVVAGTGLEPVTFGL